MRKRDCSGRGIELDTNVVAALKEIPPDLFDTAIQMLVSFAKEYDDETLTLLMIAQAIASPGFLPIIEQERRLAMLTPDRRD